MTEEEFAKAHGFDKEDVERIKLACNLWQGKIIGITSKSA